LFGQASARFLALGRAGQNIIHAGLPAGAGFAEGFDDILVEAQGDLLLGAGTGRAATADEFFADIEVGCLEPGIIEFDDLIIIRQIAFRSGLFRGHWLVSCKNPTRPIRHPRA
jgi:hypothetical protein